VGLTGGVELATTQIGRAQPPARIANGNNLAVCRRVKQSFLLTALADDLALPYNDGRKWTSIFRAQSCTAEFKRFGFNNPVLISDDDEIGGAPPLAHVVIPPGDHGAPHDPLSSHTGPFSYSHARR
jgi:hypothetical protein